MALVTRNAGDSIRALDVDQLVYALTGIDPTQPITVGQLLVAIGRDAQVNALVSPAAPTAVVNGTAGATSHTYKIVSSNTDGDAPPGAGLVVTNCNATMSSTNSVTLTWSGTNGTLNYKILKDNLLLATVAGVAGQTSTYSYTDQGTSTSAYTATTVAPGGTLVSQTPRRSRIFRNGAQSIATGAGTKLSWDNSSWDPSSWWNSGVNPTRMTVGVAGLYLVTWQATLNPGANAGTFLEADLFKNNAIASVPGGICENIQVSQFPASGGCDLLVLAANDYLEVNVKHGFAGATNTYVGGSTANFLAAHYLSN